MKPFGKKSMTSILKVIINIALVLELVIILGYFGNIYYHCFPFNSDIKKMLLFAFTSKIIFLIIAFLITLQLRKLVIEFKKEVFFELANVKRIQNISLFLFIYVLSKSTLALFDPNLNSIEKFSSITGGMPIIDIFLSFLFSIEVELLFLTAVVFVISFVFKRGCELQEQSNLTI